MCTGVECEECVVVCMFGNVCCCDPAELMDLYATSDRLEDAVAVEEHVHRCEM